MPFPLADLVEGRSDRTGGKPQSQGQDQDDSSSSQSCRSMEFKLLGLAPGEGDEPDFLYTEDDLARAVDDARRTAVLETEAAVRSAMADDVENRKNDMLAAIRDQLERRESAFEEELARLAALSCELAIALAKAVIPRAIERQPLADITDLLKVTIAGMTEAPAIELRLHSSQVESGEALMADLARDAGFAGEVTTIPDPALGEGDAELRWKCGAVSRSLDRLQAEALDLTVRWLQDVQETDGVEAFSPHSASLQSNASDVLPERATVQECKSEETTQ